MQLEQLSAGNIAYIITKRGYVCIDIHPFITDVISDCMLSNISDFVLIFMLLDNLIQRRPSKI